MEDRQERSLRPVRLLVVDRRVSTGAVGRPAAAVTSRAPGRAGRSAQVDAAAGPIRHDALVSRKPATPCVLGLRRSRANRATASFAAWMAVATAALFSVCAIVVVTRPITAGPGGVFIGGACLVWAVLVSLYARSMRRVSHTRRPTITITGADVAISDPSVFVDDQRIVVAAVREIILGPAVSRSFTGRSAWRGRRAVVISACAEMPNALMTFIQPTRLDRAFCPAAAYRSWRGRPPVASEPLTEIWTPSRIPRSHSKPCGRTCAFVGRCEQADSALSAGEGGV